MAGFKDVLTLSLSFKHLACAIFYPLLTLFICNFLLLSFFLHVCLFGRCLVIFLVVIVTSKLIHNIHALLDNGSNFQNNEHAERVMKCFQKSYIYLFLRCWLLTMIFIWYKITFICSSHALVCNWNNFSENLCSNFLNMIIHVFSQKLKGEEYAIWQIDSISIIV